MALSRITNYIEADGADLNLQTSDTTITASSVLGVINFKAPSVASGTDAILLASKIEAVAEGTFSASSNATKLSFATASSEAASEKMSLSSAGLLTVSGRIITDDTTEATSTTDGSLQTDGGLSVAKDIVAGDDVKLLSDSAVLSFGADSEIQLIHVADDGLILKHIGTGDGKEPSFTFQAGDTDIAQDDVLGAIKFQAPDEGAGTDAILVAAGIDAISEGDFSASSNATSLVFKTGASETATAKWAITSGGSFQNQGTNTIDMNAGELILDADADSSITADTDDQIDIKVGNTDTVIIKPDEMILQGPHPAFTLTDSDDTNSGGIFYGNGTLTVAADTGNTGATGQIIFQIDGNTDMTLAANGNLTLEDGDLIIGTNGHGISFAATADGTNATNPAEVLEDYEQGQWNAAVSSTSGTDGTLAVYLGNAMNNAARYIKIGTNCHVFYSVVISDWGSRSGNLTVTGLPFTVWSGGASSQDVGHFPANTNDAAVGIYGGGTTLSFPKGNGSLQGGNSEYWQISDLINTKYMIFDFTYITNDLS